MRTDDLIVRNNTKFIAGATAMNTPIVTPEEVATLSLARVWVKAIA